MSSKKDNSGVVIAGLALFSMFFGAGDLVWPIIIGGEVGSMNFYAVIGMLLTGVSLPLLGLIAMLLYEGNYLSFFSRIGKVPSLVLVFIIQAILGPVGSIPRLITLGHATLVPYFPFDISLLLFSVFASLFVLIFTLKRHKIVDLLGIVLTPVLLACLGSILYLGLRTHPEAADMGMTSAEAFGNGIRGGYSTLDLIASFIFAPFVLSHFLADEDTSHEAKVASAKKMVKASIVAALLLSGMFVGLILLSSYYTPGLDPAIPPEGRLSAIAIHLLGSSGGFIACMAIAMTCLTTTIPLVSIAADYFHETFMKNKGSVLIPQLGTLAVSALIANLGFAGIAAMLDPFLKILCPVLLVFSLVNIWFKMREFRAGLEVSTTAQ